jgi:hypothetical protein
MSRQPSVYCVRRNLGLPVIVEAMADIERHIGHCHSSSGVIPPATLYASQR